MKTCIIKRHLSCIWTQMGTHSTGTNRKTVGEQLHFSKRVIAALHNEVFNSFPTLANEYRVLTPRRSHRLLPSHFICVPGSCKGKRASSIMKQQNSLRLKAGRIWGDGTLPLRWDAPRRLSERHSNSTLWCLAQNLQLGGGGGGADDQILCSDI